MFSFSLAYDDLVSKTNNDIEKFVDIAYFGSLKWNHSLLLNIKLKPGC